MMMKTKEELRNEYWEKRGPKRRKVLPGSGNVQPLSLEDLVAACASPRGDHPGRRTNGYHLLSRNGGVPDEFGS